MNFKELVAHQYALGLYQEMNNTKSDKKIFYQPVILYNDRLITAKPYKSESTDRDTEYPTTLFLKDINNVTEISPNFSDTESNSIFVKIRHLVVGEIKDFYRLNTFTNYPELILDELSLILSELDLNQLVSPQRFLYDVTYLESGTHLPFLETDEQDTFKIVSLI